MRYFFPDQFIDVIENPVVGKISPSYTMGDATATIMVELETPTLNYAVTLTGFDNTVAWGDAEVQAFVAQHLASHAV